MSVNVRVKARLNGHSTLTSIAVNAVRPFREAVVVETVLAVRELADRTSWTTVGCGVEAASNKS